MLALLPFLFFILVTILFPLAASTNAKVLQTIGPGVIWVAVLLATLLSLPSLFQCDYDDGVLDQYVLSSQQLPMQLFIKVLVHWALCMLPLIICVPFMAVLYHFSMHGAAILSVSLLLGTPILVIEGAVVAALCVGSARSSLLVPVILLPLVLPVMVLGVNIVYASQYQPSISAQLAFLGALLLCALLVAPGLLGFTVRLRLYYE